MQQNRLLRGSTDAITLNAHYVMGEGWSLFFRSRRSLEDWREGVSDVYSRLTTEELLQLVDVVVGSALDLAD